MGLHDCIFVIIIGLKLIVFHIRSIFVNGFKLIGLDCLVFDRHHLVVRHGGVESVVEDVVPFFFYF